MLRWAVSDSPFPVFNKDSEEKKGGKGTGRKSLDRSDVRGFGHSEAHVALESVKRLAEYATVKLQRQIYCHERLSMQRLRVKRDWRISGGLTFD